MFFCLDAPSSADQRTKVKVLPGAPCMCSNFMSGGEKSPQGGPTEALYLP